MHYYRVFIKYCVSSLKFCDFFLTLPVPLQRWCSTCLVCVHTLTLRENRENRVRNILKSSKKTQYLMNTLYLVRQCIFVLFPSPESGFSSNSFTELQFSRDSSSFAFVSIFFKICPKQFWTSESLDFRRRRLAPNSLFVRASRPLLFMF